MNDYDDDDLYETPHNRQEVVENHSFGNSSTTTITPDILFVENEEIFTPVEHKADATVPKRDSRATAITRQIRSVSKAQIIGHGAKLQEIGRKNIKKFMSKVRKINGSGHSARLLLLLYCRLSFYN